ncbi:DNA polymerase III subunit gamma/tau [Nitrosospira sp. Nl5]|uniref:DNA polymerase III subunit gamma/tau n=1 Tax=Nitrosospira sp. Nl5 TaxID=200120 RepID=UPI00210CEDB0|nr:DNA polymerase III subunit gamma/tau [Nitrosospira sp. Nl5]
MSQTQVLARKWRPKIFSELTGQDHVVRALTNALEQKRLHHAYLFTGTRGIGKTTIARILAKALNCEAGITSTPCGICSACTEIDGGRFVDLIEMDAASNTQVEKMRDLLENALYAPTVARYKIYIIDEVHMLSKSAFNAMLKTLEEPPEHVKFILATTDPQKIPVTVLSRCLQFNLKQIPLPLITAHLKHVLEQEQINCDVTSLQLLARSAQGSMRDALSILDQAIAFGGGRVEEARVRDMLGAIDQSYLYDLLDALGQKDGPRMLEVADAMETRSLSFDAALQDLATLLHRVALAQIVPSAIGEDTPERERILALAKTFVPEDIQLFYQIVIHGRSDLSQAPDEYAGFTMTLMRLLAFLPEYMPKMTEPGHDREIKRPSPSVSKTTEASETLPTSGTVEKAEAAKAAKATKATAEADEAENAGNATVGAAPAVSLFGSDWATVVSQLKLGIAKELAQNCEVKNVSANEIEFCVAETHKHLLPYQDRMQAALREHSGKPVRLKFSVGTITGMTPAELDNRKKQEKQLQAVAAIEADPFVRELVEHFDAKLIVSSIKSIQ